MRSFIIRCDLILKKRSSERDVIRTSFVIAPYVLSGVGNGCLLPCSPVVEMSFFVMFRHISI